MAGRARGARAGGLPDPVRGLTAPDVPALGPKSASMEDLVLGQGYPLETYPVETYDGFILRLYRIPHGKKNATGTGPKPAVLLHHGITLASSCWVVLDPDSSMGFYLADAGFDVWLANARGNVYSRGHKTQRSIDSAYWQWSMDELALIDLPAQIDFILRRTGQRSLAIAGHSQGATLPLMLLAARPEYNSKIWLFILLGGVSQSSDVTAAFLRQQAQTGGLLLPALTAGLGFMLPNPLVVGLTSGCKQSRGADWCSKFIDFLLFGFSKEVHVADLERIAATWPSIVCTRNMEHWTQMLTRGAGVAMFDFGTACPGPDPKPHRETCNQARYGQDAPPGYDMTQVTTKALVLHGLDDTVATAAGRDALLASWGARVVGNKEYAGATHMDFIWARRPVMKHDIIAGLWAHAPPPW
ncbi:MAG: Alpha/Beta hydrolase protein [Monoraphidium minutum]|nr:MAG: Alpha/Beta hydrolase protein [Monoraphidium minutum]